jgi:hypothetical protein
MGRTRRSFEVLLLLAGAMAATPGLAQNALDAPPPAAAERPGFAYQLGRTTLDAAREYWSHNGMNILRAGHMALGTGSGVDGLGKVSAERVVLVDVSGVDFEGLSTARFGFYENKLYRIQASLALLPLNGAGATAYTEDQLKALGATLRKKYGAPSEEHRTLFADKHSGNDVLIWKLPEGELTLTENVLNGGLILSNKEMEAEVRLYVKEYCKSVNTKGRTICW